MAKSLLEQQQLNTTPDFSTLAWRFNNLNSTAKMLLVGTSSKSVPFIPISELSTSDPAYLLQLNAKKASQIHAVEPRLMVQSQPVQNKPLELEETVAVQYPLQESQEQNISTNPYSARFANYVDEELEKRGYLNRQNPGVSPSDDLLNQDEQNLNNQYTEESNLGISAPPERENLTKRRSQLADQPHWSYREQRSLESDLYSIRDGIKEKNQQKAKPANPLFKKTVQSVAILSLVALLGFGTYNLIKKNQSKTSPDPITDKEALDSDIDGATYDSSVTNSVNNTETINNYQDYEPIKIQPKKTSSYKPSKTNVSKSRVIRPATSYSPITPVSQPQVETYDPNNSRFTTNPTSFLYDPATIYDSSSENAIEPSTYTPERFPVEISYVKMQDQYEAPLAMASNNLPSENPPQAAPQVVTPSVNVVAPQLPQRFASPKPEENYESNDLSPEEQKILNSVDSSEDETNTPASTSSIKVPSGYPMKQPEQTVEQSYQPTYSPKPQPIYTEPLSKVNDLPSSKIEDELDDSSLSVPILREPIRSSKVDDTNRTFGSPYEGNVPMTTTSYVPAEPLQRNVYTSPSKAKVTKMFPISRPSNRVASDSPEENLDTSKKLFRSSRSITKPSSTENQKPKINILSRRTNTNAADVKALEADANSVYLRNTPYT
jgi:hypothetical protein